jgi:hypothetical protein
MDAGRLIVTLIVAVVVVLVICCWKSCMCVVAYFCAVSLLLQHKILSVFSQANDYSDLRSGLALDLIELLFSVVRLNLFIHMFVLLPSGELKVMQGLNARVVLPAMRNPFAAATYAYEPGSMHAKDPFPSLLTTPWLISDGSLMSHVTAPSWSLPTAHGCSSLRV